jgi:hypothetical protein
VEAPFERVYYRFISGGIQDLLEFRERLLSRGVRNVNCFLPDVIVCDLPLDAGVVDDPKLPGVLAQREREIILSRHAASDSRLQWVKRCYSSVVEAPPDRFDNSTASVRSDLLIVPDEVLASPEFVLGDTDPEEARNPQQNSEFLMGDILAQIVFPESAGRLEDWTSSEISTLSADAIAAMLYYQKQFALSPINYIFRVIERAPTSLEPINFSVEDDRIWVADLMDDLGFTRSPDEHLQAVNDFNNDGRDQYGADWVFTAFVVRAVNAPLHNFPGQTIFGYSYLGGPYFTITYPLITTKGVVVSFSQMFKHHVGHIFWCLDEDPVGGTNSLCRNTSGYLAVRNGNKTVSVDPEVEGCVPGLLPKPCIMNREDAKNGYVEAPCSYSAGMLGVSDDNLNSVPDVVDAPPIIKFNRAGVETVTTVDPGFRFKAVSIGVQNRNPHHEPENRVTYVPPVKDVSFSIWNTGPYKLLPEDGKSDEAEEDFLVRIPVLLPGFNDIDVMTRNVFGASSAEYSKRIFYIALDYSDFGFDFKKKGIELYWSARGETFDVKYDLHRMETGTSEGDVVIATDLLPSGPRRGSLLPFSYFDDDVTAGNEYSYYVEGSFTIDYRGAPTTFKSNSGVFTVRAPFPISGSFLSSPSPNPFRNEVWISIKIPQATQHQAPNGVASGTRTVDRQQIVAQATTPVEVSVYDVLGRKVKSLFVNELFPTTLTISWDGMDDKGTPVPSGVYFFRVRAGDETDVGKAVMVR